FAGERGVRRRDDQVREPVARYVGQQPHPGPEEAVRPLVAPLPDRGPARPRPDGGVAVLLRPLLELEASAGGDVRVAVAVDVERLAEAEAELAPREAPPEA